MQRLNGGRPSTCKISVDGHSRPIDDPGSSPVKMYEDRKVNDGDPIPIRFQSPGGEDPQETRLSMIARARFA
jgi:hypothetical protein